MLLHAEDAHRLEHAQRAQRIGIRGVLGLLERHRDVALRGEVVDLVGLHLLMMCTRLRGVRHVAVMQEEPRVRLVRVLVQVVDASRC